VIKLPSETFISENELSLLSLMNTIGPLKNQLYVQQTTYIAQELDWVNTNYNFDFELGFPFSNQLESDLSCLESKELVYNTNMGNSLVVTEEGKKQKINFIRDGELLKGLSSAKLITLSRILYLRKHPIWKNDIFAGATNVFFTPKEDIENGKEILENAGIQL
jgi:hypothetical protein